MKEIIKKRRLESSVFIYLPKGFRPVRFRKPDRSWQQSNCVPLNHEQVIFVMY